MYHYGEEKKDKTLPLGLACLHVCLLSLILGIFLSIPKNINISYVGKASINNEQLIYTFSYDFYTVY